MDHTDLYKSPAIQSFIQSTYRYSAPPLRLLVRRTTNPTRMIENRAFACQEASVYCLKCVYTIV